MGEPSAATTRIRALLAAHAEQIDVILARYDASGPRIFGSVARGDAVEGSDLDLLVDLAPGGNPLLRVAGLGEELSDLLGLRVDVVAQDLLRGEVSATALHDAVAV